MNIVIFALVFLISVPLVSGYINSMEVTIGIELNVFNSPFYKIGIFSQRYTLEDGSVEDEFTIGLFFINLSFVFWKGDVPYEEDEE